MRSREIETAAVLLPTHDELGSTIDRSILNLALRMKEVKDIAWVLLIGVNGTDKQEDVARVEHLVNSHAKDLSGIIVKVSHYVSKGKESAMNQLAEAARTIFDGGSPDVMIGTDVKVYRTPGSLNALISEFEPHYLNNENPRYLGASVLPYPIETYEKYFDIDDLQRLFYTLLEIDKHPIVQKYLPKTHLRGGLYITGEWSPLAIDAPDDYSISRDARLKHGLGAVQVSQEAVGYVIPRQSFADYFAVRVKRSIPAEEKIKKEHPEWANLRDLPMSEEERKHRLSLLQEEAPILYGLYLTKKELDKKCREIAQDLQSVEMYLEKISNYLKNNGIQIPDSMDLQMIEKLALEDPKGAAYLIIYYHRSIVQALALDINSIEYGPRQERYRGMLPLDLEEPIEDRATARTSA